MGGRRTGDGYKIYGFTHSVVAGKHIAICRNCNKPLHNTAASRMKIHRNNCKAYSQFAHIDVPRTRQERHKRKSDGERNETVFKLESEACHPNGIGVNSNEDQSNANSYFEHIKEVQNYLKENPLDEPESIARAELLLDPTSTRIELLQEDKLRAEIEYFKKRTEYYTKELENSTIQRTLMLLQAKKLRLEIDRFEESSRH